MIFRLREKIGEWILPLTLFLDPFCVVFGYYSSYIVKSIRRHDRRSRYYERCFWENCDRLTVSRKGIAYLLPYNFPKLFAREELPVVIFALPIRIVIWIYWLPIYLIVLVIELFYCFVIKRIILIVKSWRTKVRSLCSKIRYIYDDSRYPSQWPKRPKICVICWSLCAPEISDCCVPDSTIAIRPPASLYKKLYDRYYDRHISRGSSFLPFYDLKELTSNYSHSGIYDYELSSEAYRFYDRMGRELSAEEACQLREDRLKKALADLPGKSFWKDGCSFEKAWEYLLKHNCVYLYSDSMNSQRREDRWGPSYSINKNTNGEYGLWYSYQEPP